jgi:signal transduction histidine kinase
MGSSGDESRRGYEVESRALCEQAARTCCWLALPLIVAFGLLESFALIDAPAYFPWLRLGCASVIALVLLALRTPFWRHHPAAVFTLVIAAVGEMLIGMTLSTGREESPYFVGLALLLMAAAVLMPWRARWSMGTAVALVASYALATLAGGPVAHQRLFVSNCALLAASGLIAVVSTAFRERLRRREYENRIALVDALQHRRDFMAKMSHELRTPLHVIIGYADILLEELVPTEDDEARALVDRSRTCAVSLHRMISDLLDYAKVEAGKMEVRSEPVCVEEVVEQMEARFRPLIERKGLAMEVSCTGDVPAVTSDRERLEQILVNLIGNAVKFTERGSVSLDVCPLWGGAAPALAGFRFLEAGGRADEPARLAGPYVAILVHDTGVGIEAHDLLHLAEDFQQVGATAEGRGGTGLGLSISKRLAQLLGGRIAVRSRPGEGSTFALLLPASGPAQRAAA